MLVDTLFLLFVTRLLSFFQGSARAAPICTSPPTVTIRHYTLRVSETTIWASCQPQSPATVYNGTLPGPILRARVGEILQVRVYNDMAERNTTTHFHGFTMHLHPIMDGTTLVSQWPVAPGSFFDYRIPITSEDVGTYFYHSHVSLQAMTAYGAMIVEDAEDAGLTKDAIDQVALLPSDTVERHVYGEEGLAPLGASTDSSPFQWDEDRGLLLGDFYNNTNADKIGEGLEADPFHWPGSPVALVVNGKSSPSTAAATCDAAKAAAAIGVSCDTAPPGCATDYPEVRFDYDKTYRLRFIGATSLMYTSAAIFSSPDVAPGGALEQMQLIEADGTYLSPLPVDHVEVGPGQRYSALYHSKTQDQVERDGGSGAYWLRVESRWRAGPSLWIRIIYPQATSLPTPPVLNATSRLLPNETFGWKAPDLAPLPGYSDPIPPDSAVTRTMVIHAQQIPFWSDGKGVRWAQNKLLYNETNRTQVPYLVQTFLGTVPIPSAHRAFSPHNPWNADPVGKGLIRGVSDLALEKALAAEHHLGQGYDDERDMYVLRPHEVVDIVIVGRASQLANNSEIHPWHLHSKKHWTRTIQRGTFSFAALDAAYRGPSAGFRNPIRRDTTVVYAGPGASYLNETIPDPLYNDGGWAVLRYKVDAKNAGIFLLHCHIHLHLAMGMAVLLAVAPDQLVSQAMPYLPTGDGPRRQVQGVDEGYLHYGSDVVAIDT